MQNTQALKAIEQFVESTPNISEKICNVHNHLVHFSSIDLDAEIRNDLYFIHELSQLVKQLQPRLEILLFATVLLF